MCITLFAACGEQKETSYSSTDSEISHTENADESAVAENETVINSPGNIKPRVTVSTDKMYWVRYDLSKSYFQTAEELEKLAPEYLDEVEKLLNIPDWWAQINPNTENITMVFEISSDNKSEARVTFAKEGEKSIYCTISLSELFIEEDIRMDGAMAHEITHAIGFSNNCFSISLCEGISEYSQKHIGDWEFSDEVSEQDYDVHLYRYLKQRIADGYITQDYLDDMLNEVGTVNNTYIFFGNKSQLSTWYRFCASFTDYMISEYGVDKVVELALHGTSESSYKDILGVEFETVKGGWFVFLETYEPPMTFEELNSMK